MSKPTVSIVVALDEERGIGKKNTLPWHLPEDLKRFKQLTLGHPVIMGRKTHESIGRLLPQRTNIILTTNHDYQVEGAVMAYSLDEAIAKAKEVDKEEIFIIGGGQIFSEALPVVDRLYLTLLKGRHGCTVFFPDYSMFTKKVAAEVRDKYTFLTLER